MRADHLSRKNAKCRKFIVNFSSTYFGNGDFTRPYLVQKQDGGNFHFVRGRAKRQRIISTTHTTVKQFCTRSLLKFRSLVQNFHRGGRKGRRNFFSMDTTLPNFWRRKMAGCPTATVRSTSSRCRLLPTTAPSGDNLAGSCFPK